MRDFISTTPLAEYVDMLWNRLAIEMPKHTHVLNWWIALHPPGLGGRLEKGVGFTEFHALTKSKRVMYRADMRAVQMGAKVSPEILEQVVEHHIAQLVEALSE